MRNALLLNYKFDGNKTEEAVVKELQRVKRPLNYHELFDRCAVRSNTNEVYSENTDPKEKFRQYFSDCSRTNIVFISGGYIALRDWFPTTQKTLFPPEPYDEKILGNCSISWDAGYEIAKREPHMNDHFGDAHSRHRLERRKRASLVESHVKSFFEDRYSEFYVNPSNYGRYELPAIDDFGLRFPISRQKVVNLKVDVKSFSSSQDKDGVIRNPKNDVVYLFADIDKENNVSMYGLGKGDYLKEIGITEKSLTIIRNNFLLPIDKLIVMLNVSKCGMDYMEILSNVNT